MTNLMTEFLLKVCFWQSEQLQLHSVMSVQYISQYILFITFIMTWPHFNASHSILLTAGDQNYHLPPAQDDRMGVLVDAGY